jgi:hypothetical protein
MKRDYSYSRHSRGVNFALGLPSSKLPTFSEGGNPVDLINTRVTKQLQDFVRFAELIFLLDSRLRGNDGGVK